MNTNIQTAGVVDRTTTTYYCSDCNEKIAVEGTQITDPVTHKACGGTDTHRLGGGGR